jgi:hypothetical protein
MILLPSINTFATFADIREPNRRYPMIRQEQQLVKQACHHLGIDYNKIMDAKVYPDRVVIIDPIGRKLTCNYLNLPRLKPRPRFRSPRKPETKPEDEK